MPFSTFWTARLTANGPVQSDPAGGPAWPILRRWGMAPAAVFMESGSPIRAANRTAGKFHSPSRQDIKRGGYPAPAVSDGNAGEGRKPACEGAPIRGFGGKSMFGGGAVSRQKDSFLTLSSAKAAAKGASA